VIYFKTFVTFIETNIPLNFLLLKKVITDSCFDLVSIE